MNLFDIVKRKDRCLLVEAGEVETIHSNTPVPFFGIVLKQGTKLRLIEADRFTALRNYPRVPSWMIYPATATSRIDVIVRAVGRNRDDVLFRASSSSDQGIPVVLDWRFETAFAGGFDLMIENAGSDPCRIASTWVFNPRVALRPLIRGDGVEVGPGTNPFVKPERTVRVRYIEAAPMDEWMSNYDKGRRAQNVASMWDSYIVGDAQTLDILSDESINFVFSSHVFEHLMNPLGVLENWSRKLKPDGIVVAVVPDARYCFDLRQPPSQPSEWINEYISGTWALGRNKYEKWCQHTAPYATPESLIARKYSIHAHYYTTDTITGLLDMAIERGWFSTYFLNAAPNNKDFGFALRR